MTGLAYLAAAASAAPAMAPPGALIWLVAVLVAAAAFALAVVVFRLPRVAWISLAAALVFGLAGYTLQASPNVAAAPKAEVAETYVDEWEMIPSRELLVGSGEKSRDPAMITADGFARRGQFEDAAGFYRVILSRNPQDFEAWVALSNALVEQADGNLTQASVYALRQANLVRPDSPAPGYFLGLSLIRQGRMMEARSVWREALDGMGQVPADNAAKAFLTDRVERLDSMLQEMGALPPAAAAPQEQP